MSSTFTVNEKLKYSYALDFPIQHIEVFFTFFTQSVRQSHGFYMSAAVVVARITAVVAGITATIVSAATAEDASVAAAKEQNNNNQNPNPLISAAAAAITE